jgi:hypothetical protein
VSAPEVPPIEAAGSSRPRCVLVCNAGSRLNLEGVARWLSSFTDLAGIVVIEESAVQTRGRVRRELKRIGAWRMLDVLAFRLFYAATLARSDAQWLQKRLDAIARRYPPLPPSLEVLRTPSPNTPEVAAFVKRLAPDFMLARCKNLLKEEIFSIPRHGTFVLHPGVCPEYRNAHGAFWALALDDIGNVGLTLLKIDRGVDTGPVYGYYSYDFDEINESHIVIMTRVVFDNFDVLRDRMLEILAGTARPIDTTGRRSAVWGQPWLTAYLRWKRQARNRRHASSLA